jgi:HPt (histidine-containing phosphotransfer) domain-containing protein
MSQATLSSAAEPIYSLYREEPDFQELLDYFVTTAAERRVELQSLYESRSVDDLRVQAHQLKGAGGGYGYPGLSELAATLETACKQPLPNLDEIGPLLDQLVDYLGRVQA